jgi:rhamnosyltransferase
VPEVSVPETVGEPVAGDRLSVTAVLTAYHPDERLAAVVESALEDCGLVIVVDNTPAGSPSLAAGLDHPRVRLIAVGTNLGLGGALNVAMKQLPREAEAVLLLDQDSILPEGLVRSLAVHLRDDQTIGIAAPTPWDAKHESFYNVGAGRRASVADREVVITSGMLVRRDLVDRIRFRQDLFNDFVDIAFCVAVRRTGARIVQDYSLKLPHSMGDRREHRLGPLAVRVIHYPAWRHYWIARNGMRMALDDLRMHPQGMAAMAIFLARKFVSTALFEPDRRAHLPALARGVRDGMRNRASARYLPEGANPPGLRVRS